MIPLAEKTHLQESLAGAFDEFITLFSSFHEDEVNQMPFPGSWTPGQVAIHIILATDGLPDTKTASADRPFDGSLPRIRPWWTDLNQKFQSPEPLKPDNRPKLKHQLLSHLHRVKSKDLAIISEKNIEAICLDFELPAIGHLTRFEWLWFIEMHLKRHSFQLRNMLTVRVDLKKEH